MTWYQVAEIMRAAARESIAFPWATCLLGGVLIFLILFFLWCTFKGDKNMESWKATSLMAAILVICALAMVAGCATTDTAAGSKLKQVTLADLEAAKASADANGDAQASLCYGKVIDWVNAKGGATADIKGVFSAFESARLVRRGIDQGIPEDLHNACAPLVVDAHITLLKLGLIAGGAGL